MPNATVEDKGDRVEVVAHVPLVPISRMGSHELDGGFTTFRCPHCDEDHPLAFVDERDTDTGERSHVSVQWEEEAFAIAEFLLVEAFGVVSPGTWAAMQAMATIEAKSPEPAMN